MQQREDASGEEPRPHFASKRRSLPTGNRLISINTGKKTEFDKMGLTATVNFHRTPIAAATLLPLDRETQEFTNSRNVDKTKFKAARSHMDTGNR